MLYFHAMLKKYDISTNTDVLPKCPKIGITVGSLLKFLAKTFQAVRNCTLLVDLPGFESPSMVTGDQYRPDLLLTTSDKRLYIIELTVGHKSNLANNVTTRKPNIKN